MKRFKNIFFPLFVCLCFLSVEISAQYTEVVTPMNADSSADRIKTLYKQRVNISVDSIRNFFLQQWEPGQTYSSLCQYPKARVTSADSTDVSFEWGHFPLASTLDNFFVSYLRLSDGASETIPTEDYAINISVSNDLYLFAFQTKCGNIRSALDIIIIEKPIEIILQSLTCNCQDYDLVWTTSPSPFKDSPLVSYTWQNTNPIETYYCYVAFTHGPSASFTADIAFGAGGPETITVDSTCMTNIDSNIDRTFIFLHEPNDIETELGMFCFLNNLEQGGPPQFSFNVTADAPYNLDKIYLYKCGNMLRSENEQPKIVETQNGVSLKSFPNPFKTDTIIEYNLLTQEKISIEVFNVDGKRVKIFKDQVLTEAGTHQLSLDLSDLTDGVYLCVLRTQEDAVHIRLAKAN